MNYKFECAKSSKDQMDRRSICEFYRQKHDELLSKGKLHGGPYELKFNNNKTRAGMCLFSPPSIFISNYFVNSPRTTSKDIKDVILHELAHAMTGPYVENPHGVEWKTCAKEIGCSGDRCSKPFITLNQCNYILKCPKGCKTGRHKLPTKFVSSPKRCAKHSLKILVYKKESDKYVRYISTK